MSKEKNLVPEIRFEGFEGNWDELSFKDFVVRLSNNETSLLLPRIEFQDINSGSGTLNNDVSLNDNKHKAGLLFKKGNILFGKLRPYLKNWFKPRFTGVAVGDFWVFENRENSNIDFLYQLIQTEEFYYVSNLSSGSKMPRSDWNTVKEHKFMIPDVKEQEKIGALFSKLDLVIENQEKLVETSKKYKTAMLQKMFPKEGESVPEVRFAGFEEEWHQSKIKEIAKIVGGGTPDTNNEEYWEGAINWFTPTELKGVKYIDRSQRSITTKGLQESSARLLPKDKTILFTSRATIGEMAILRKDSCTNQGFQSIVVNDLKTAEFIYSMKNIITQKALRLATGSTFLEISKKDVENIKLSIPQKEEQEKIGNFFKTLDEQIEAQEEKLETYKKLKQSLLQKMFV